MEETKINEVEEEENEKNTKKRDSEGTEKRENIIVKDFKCRIMCMIHSKITSTTQ